MFYPVHAARTRFDVTHVTLHVRKSNLPAIRLYTSLAFDTTMIKPGFCESVCLVYTKANAAFDRLRLGGRIGYDSGLLG